MRDSTAAPPPCDVVLYDGQCEICQAGVSWLRVLDRQRGRVDCRPIETDEEAFARRYPDLSLEDCLRELHVVAPDGRIRRGWDAVARLARRFPLTRPIGWIGSVPPFRWIFAAGYRFVARNRYALSKCRGGACRSFRPKSVRRRSGMSAFWSCYTLGLLLRLPLVAAVTTRGAVARITTYARTFRRRIDFLDGRLSLFFIGGFPCDLISIFFGEQFTMVLYRGIAMDPGSPKMRRSLARHLRRIADGEIRTVVATHQHEEHVGNLNWLARQRGVPLLASARTIARLTPPARLPLVRSVMIGQPPPLEPPYEELGPTLAADGVLLEVLPAPGHCDDHIVLWDPSERVLIAGDAFMGAYFATPNPDVDSRVWIESLERLVDLPIEILVEGHGHVHTLRRDIPDVPGVVVRKDPRAELAEKLAYLRWLREQVDAGVSENLPVRAIEASCFPWNGSRRGWESFATDELTRAMSLGHFSRTEVVKSFQRTMDGGEVFPTVYEVRLRRRESAESQPPQD
jgi:glyoxylase-like metal-dependent hydrolase (beta-lactamase superfamily II)/predicted DCC family thiol-disulfide oxidoreductase YuxK